MSGQFPKQLGQFDHLVAPSPRQGGGMGWGLIHWLQHYWWAALFTALPMLACFLFIYSYGWRFIVHDQWWVSIPIAMEVKNGTLTLSDLAHTTPTGHKLFFTNLHTAFLVQFTNWNMDLELFVNPLTAVANFALLVYLFWRQAPARLHWAMIFFSLLIFALCQNFNWIFSFESSWYFVDFFLLLVLGVLATNRIGWLPLLIAAGLAFCGAISMAHGVVIWVVGVIVMLMYGYRNPLHYLVWLILAVLSTYYFFATSQIDTSAAEGDWTSVAIPPLTTGIPYLLGYLGAPLSGGSYTIAILMGLAGLLLFLVNSYFVWQRSGQGALIIWWGCVAFAIGVGMVVSLTRLNGRDPAVVALTDRYITNSVIFWVGIAALGVLNLEHPRLTNLHIVFVSIALPFYLLFSGQAIQSTAAKSGNLLGSNESNQLNDWQACLINFPLVRDYTCLDPILTPEPPDNWLYQAAVYRLNMFDDYPQVNVLPETYQPGSPILLNTTTLWLNIYMHQYLLQDIPPDDLLHISPPYHPLSDPYIQHEREPHVPLLTHQINDATDLAALEQFIAGREQVWYITIPERAAEHELITAFMTERGYLATPYPIQHPYYRLAKYSVFRFQLPPDQLTTSLYFGDEKISMQSWTVFNSRGDSRVALASEVSTLTVSPCENIRVQSWWTSESIPTYNYSTTLVLIAPDGRTIAQKDAAIGDTLLQLWEPGKLYLDERILTVPCDAAPGDYQLTWGTYLNTGSGFEDLPAYDASGNDLGTRAPLTTLSIGASR